MYAALTALVLAAISQVAHTTVIPLDGPANAQWSRVGVTTAASFPVHTLDIARNATQDGTIHRRGTHGGTTGTHDGTTGTHDAAIRPRSPAANPAELLLCPNVGCASCTAFALNALPEDECFLTSVDAFSVAILQPLGGGLPFLVDVGTPGCASLANIPTVNECFNVNGGPFTNFALIP